MNGEGAVQRLLAAGSALPLEMFNPSAPSYNRFVELSGHPLAMLHLVVPTGSGKTTTLDGLLGFFKTSDRKIGDAEDPCAITPRPGVTTRLCRCQAPSL